MATNSQLGSTVSESREQSQAKIARLYTARYANKTLATHPAAKVQTSLGAPKFKLPYQLAATVIELSPAGWMLGKAESEFANQYTKLLERRGGIAYFARRLAEVATAVDVDELVLLCFEDLRTPGAWCHRGSPSGGKFGWAR